MDKDINRIKVVLAEKGGAARLLSVSWRDTKEPISGWQSSWDVTSTAVSKWCTNDCQPTMETFLKIAEPLDVELTELVRTKKSQTNHPSS